MTVYVSNAFSLQMVTEGKISIREITKSQFNKMKGDAYSIMGHEDMANLHDLPFNRESIQLKDGDIVLIAQITGGRLPEGATKLPEGVNIKYLEVFYEAPN